MSGTAADGQVYVGLMSGTSLDGISAAVVRFHDEAEGGIRAELLAALTIPYRADQRDRLARAVVGGTAAEYCRLGFDLGEWLAAAAVAVTAEAGVARRDIRAIGSHGQTLWHDRPHSTWQLGESAVIAERTGIQVISDFRVSDVAAGGQGAPLVPIADALLFAAPSHWRALQNLGGIGNVSIVPPRGTLDGVRAFDTGPGVIVIDAVVQSLAPALRFDAGGAIAAAGSPIASVVDALLAADFFQESPPKSTGRELFDAAYCGRFIAACRDAPGNASTADIVATATMLTARSIAVAVQRFIPEPVVELLVSGGGARNRTLVDMIGRALDPIAVRPFDAVYFDGDSKEAVSFALLAHLHLTGREGNVPRVTGARGRRVLGKRVLAPER